MKLFKLHLASINRVPRHSARFPAAIVLTLLVLAVGDGLAGAEGTKPFRAARLTFLQGEVRVQQANSSANSTAVVNMPLIEGTVISSGADGQAEVEFEDGSLARLTPNSGLSLVNLSVDSSGTYQTRIVLLGGLSYLELRAGTKFAYSVDAGGDIISPIENATVRVSFDEPPAAIAVLDGSAHISAAGGGSVDAGAGQTVRNDAGSESAVYTIKPGVAPESWDRWNEDRDEAAASEENSQTDVRSRFAGNQGYGWSDLDASGNWYDLPGHGQVWQPDISATQDGSEETGDANGTNQDYSSGGDFDPYGFGSWAWTPAGYSWASGYGWGWLPYRCGQWAYYDGFGWAWSPNLYCGVYGFGGYGYGGYGFGLNLGRIPGGYKRPHRPLPGPGPIHPILRGRTGHAPVTPIHQPGRERIIAGTIVQPIQPVGTGFVAGGSSLGAGLRRDYPIDSRTHAPVSGVAASTHGGLGAGSNARSAWQVGNTGGGSSGTNLPRGAYEPPGRVAPGVIGYQPVPGESRPSRGAFEPGSTPRQPGSFSVPSTRPSQPISIQRPSAAAAPRPSAPAAPVSHSAPAPAAPKGK